MKAIAGVLTTAMVMLLFAGTAWADAGHLAGSYSHDEDASETMIDAFTPAIDEMSRMRRGFARRAVRNRPDPSGTIRIEYDEESEEVSLHYDEEPTLTVPLSGEQIRHEEHDGDIRKVTAKMDGEALVLESDVDDGEYTTRYELNGDRLEITSHIDFDSLPKVVEYNLVYRAQ